MQNVIWDKPVVAGGKLVFGPLEARRFLMSNWPHRKDLNFAAADACILRALDGLASPDEARELFEKALGSARLVTASEYRLAG
ncbi:DUF982 domain-containing protein (plasmid) [Aliirhizobium terrae]|uniref:DUF982 domain-containing protein n=1 Tax=Terrirhizobium terrae TaxID=2926709 RepID=UPI002575FE7D|nr:DUF982 domain-containing protein [Rhizobium sp. CC-CFT758]WJH38478.1 DUF982 domain-containing protein [Rhizobium sp. CC-CFT758]